MRRARTSVRALRAVIAGGLALSFAAPAFAQDRPATWLKKPSEEDLMGVWPKSVEVTGEPGKALISCTITVQGAARDCRVTSETPPGSGFGQAGLALTPQFMFRPAMKDGKPVESKINIPITWPQVDRSAIGSRAGQNPALGDNPTRMLSNVIWTQAPSVSEVLAAYPPKARAAKVIGRANLDCTLTRSGALHDCETLGEEPSGQGFGGAAHRLAARFVGPTVDGAGKSLNGAHVQVPFVFDAEALAGPNPVIGKPNWTALPGFEDLTDAFPKDAIKANILKGRVVLHCAVGADGSLTGCDVRSEDPAGYGLGKATAGLVGKFKVSVWSAEGLPTIGGSVNVPIRYDLSDTVPPAKP